MKKNINDTLFVACFGLNRNRMKRETGDFVLQVKDTGNAREFTKNSEEAYHIVQKVFHAKPVLLHDFQALFDTEGHLYFIDLDGHFNYDPNGWTKDQIHKANKCLLTIKKVDKLIQKAI